MSFSVTKDNSGRIIRKSLNTNSTQPTVTTNSSLAATYSVFTTNANTLTLNNINVTSSAEELNKTDGITPGTAIANKPLVLDSNKNITNINSITCSNIIINGNSLGGNSGQSNLFLNNINPGTANNSKAVVVDSNRNITNLNNINANQLSIQGANLAINDRYESYCNTFITNEFNNSNNWIGMCWADTLNLFVAISNTGTGNRIMTSPDGITWTIGMTPVDNNWTSICWSNQLGLLVAVSSSGTGNRVMTSSDAITWTSRITPADNNWQSVCWSPELSLFVAVSSSGNNDKVMTSPNGINWTLRTSPGPDLINKNSYNNLETIEAGGFHSLALLNDGTVRAWGRNGDGQLGNGNNTNQSNPVLVNISNVIAISGGGYYSLALLNNGTVRSWGRNTNGQLGNNTTTSSNIPVVVQNILSPIAISGGWSHAMALFNDGTIKAWGNNGAGQLGDASTTQRNTPVNVYGINNAIAISGGWDFSLALLSDGRIKSWGTNTYGQLGDGSTTNRSTPVFVSGITNAIAISASAESHSLALLADGTIKAWGRNNNGQLGDNSTTNSNIPVTVLNINNAIRIGTGFHNSFAVLADGTVKAWGNNDLYQLGDSTTSQRNTPVSVSNLSNVYTMSNSDHSLVLLNDGTLQAWGNNSFGQLGNNTTTSSNVVNVRTSSSDSNPLSNIRLNYSNQWNSVCWSRNLNLFVAVGGGLYNSISRVMTSSNGINWTIRMSSEYNNWKSVCWAAEAGVFIAIANSGINRIMTSINGINWISRSSHINNNWDQIIWSNEFKIGIAISNNFSNSKIILSSDGINWIPIQTNIKKKITSVAWSYTLKKFCFLTNTDDSYRYLANWELSPAPIGSITPGTNNSITSECRAVEWISQLNLFIVVGLMGKILTSSTGKDWIVRTPSPSNSTLSINSVAYSPSLNLLVAVGDGRFTSPYIMTSPDGITWTSRTGPASNNWIHIIWGNGIFVAIAQNAPSTSQVIMTSADGINWTARTAPSNGEWWKVRWIAELNLYIAIGTSSGGKIMTSLDAITWTTRSVPEENNWKDLAWSPTLNLLVAVADAPTSNMNPIMTSTDGITWFSQNAPRTSLYSIRWINELNMFVAISNNGSPSSYLYSQDGISWNIGFTKFNQNFFSFAWSPTLEKFVLAATTSTNNENIIISLADASNPNMYSLLTTYDSNKKFNISKIIKDLYPSRSIIKYGLKGWHNVPYPTEISWNAVLWMENNNRYILTGSNNSVSQKIFHSTNGYEWSGVNITTSFTGNALAFSPELNIVVCVGFTTSASNGYHITSNDGSSWNARTTTPNNNWTSICWSPDLMLFVAVSNTGNYNRAMISNDGITWIPQSTSNNNWNSICWSSELNLFVAVASSGTNRVMTSNDGINWILRSAASNLNWTSICWAPELLLFVAVASSGTGNRIMTSSDGINWTSRNSPEDNEWNSVIWVPELRIFVSVASTGTNRLMYSFDGIDWKLISLTINNSWKSIAWSKDFGQFMMVSTDGIQTKIYKSRFITLTELNSPINNKFLNKNGKLSFNIYNPSFTHQFEYGNSSLTFGVPYSPSYYRMGISNSTTFEFNSSSDFSINISDHNGSNAGLSLNNNLIISTGNKINQISSSRPGIGVNSKALVVDSNRDISNINNISCNSITINSLFNNITEGQTNTNSLIITNSNKEINNLNSLGTNILKIKNTNLTTYENKLVSNINYALTFTRSPIIQGPNTLINAAWSPELGLFVAITNNISNNFSFAISYNGYNWIPYNTLTSTIELRAIAWSSKLSLFVMSRNNSNTFYRSSNGTSWISTTVPTSATWISIAWSPELEMFAAIANNTNNGLAVITSPDGINWTSRSATDGGWTKIIAAKGQFIAVGNGISILTSSNGITWSTTNIGFFTTWVGITYSPLLDLFVVVGSNGRIATSTNLTNWTLIIPPVLNGWNNILWISELSIFIVTANSGANESRIIYSFDSINWYVRSKSNYNHNFSDIVWAPQLSRLILLYNNTQMLVSNSSSISNITDFKTSIYETNFNKIIEKNTKPIGCETNMVNTWIARNSSTINNWTSICRAPELNLFVAVSSSGTGNRVMTSSNGISWSTQISAVDNDWTSICWSKELTLLVAISNSGTGDRIMTSSDGINWTSRTSASDNNWTSIIWVPELTLFVAVASSGTGDRVMTSPDGINWTSRTSASDNNWTSICWSKELTLLVAISNSGTGNRVMTSPDGINWTSRTSASDNNWTSICWADTINIFIAVSNTGETNKQVMTSIDGVNWNIQSCDNNNNWKQVIWISEFSMAVAISDSGDNRIMSSFDGINWNLRNLSIKNNWTSLTWAYDLGLLCAVSTSNTNNQVAQTIMTYPTYKNTLIAYPGQLNINNSNGYVGLGISSPNYQLQLSNDSAYKLSTSTWTVSSDIRLKKNIQDANLDECYNNIKNLPLKRYKWKDEIYSNNQVSDRSKLGWLADDVQNVFPNSVKEIEAFGYSDCKSMNSDQIIASLYGCIKKLISISEQKKDIITQLETKLNNYKNIINSLEIVEE